MSHRFGSFPHEIYNLTLKTLYKSLHIFELWLGYDLAIFQLGDVGKQSCFLTTTGVMLAAWFLQVLNKIDNFPNQVVQCCCSLVDRVLG